MPTARKSTFALPERVFRKKYKRAGIPTKVERALVAQFVADQPCEITPKQVTGLASTLRRSKEVVRGLIDEARDEFATAAGHYVEVHKTAVDLAVANGDAKSLEVAVRGSEWAIERISEGGSRVIDKPTNAPAGNQVFIGVKLGGANPDFIEASTPDEHE